MDFALVLTALMLGASGSWHCALMCGPLCAARPAWPLLVGRSIGYTLAGGLLAAASSWGAHFVLRGGAGPWSPWLTLWALAHAAALSLGLYLLWTGRQPMWLAAGARRPQGQAAIVRWAPVEGRSLSTATAGMAWAAMPCGLLQSAWVVAALAPGAAGGAAVMMAFSLASMPGLIAGPVLIEALRRRGDSTRWQDLMTRGSGLMMASASSWALGHGLWVHMREVC